MLENNNINIETSQSSEAKAILPISPDLDSYHTEAVREVPIIVNDSLEGFLPQIGKQDSTAKLF
jgi:hypothetical protein